MDNMDIYTKYREVPKEALKAFDNGKFKGTDINTIWRIRCLTEMFGPCGIGWYFVPKRLWIEETPIKEQFAFAEIELFIKVDGEWSKPISGNGGNKITRVLKNGDYSTSDEGFKMAVTDAFGVACRNLGIGANVYWANDRSKFDEDEPKKEKKRQLPPELLEKCKDFDIQLENLCTYYKKDLEDLTEQEIEDAIEMKRQALAQRRTQK